MARGLWALRLGLLLGGLLSLIAAAEFGDLLLTLLAGGIRGGGPGLGGGLGACGGLGLHLDRRSGVGVDGPKIVRDLPGADRLDAALLTLGGDALLLSVRLGLLGDRADGRTGDDGDEDQDLDKTAEIAHTHRVYGRGACRVPGPGSRAISETRAPTAG